MERVRSILVVASVAWLAAGAVFNIEGFGIPSFVAYRPAFFLLFLAVNAFACAMVVSEILVTARPSWQPRHAQLVQAIAGSVLLVSVLVYLEFVQSHAVTASVH